MDILVNVANQKLKIATNLKSLVAGTQEFVRFVFNTSGDWDGLATFAQFRQNGVAYNQYLDDDKAAYLPSEIGVGTCTVMLYGSNGNTIATTNYLTLTIDENILVSDAQSTDISLSLYNQLVSKVNSLSTWNEQNAADLIAVDKDLQQQINQKASATDLTTEIARAKAAEKANADAIALKASQADVDDLTIKVTQLENNEVVAELISEAVTAEMEEYMSSGQLASMTIADGSISRKKVNADLENTLVKADTAMQPSMYDPQGLKIDVYAYAQGKADTVQKNLNDVKAELQDGYKLTDTLQYTKIGDAIRGAVTLSRTYAQALLADYKAFTIKIVDVLPVTGESMTFYLVPNKAQTGYDKYWWVTDDNGDSKWDVFGSASTLVVTELPEIGDEDTDYILKSNGGCLYYKYIDGVWEVVAGSLAYVSAILPSVENGNEFTDYYIVQEESGSYLHYRFVNGSYHVIGGDSYTKDEINALLSAISDSISAIESKANATSGEVDLIQAKVDELGNLVSDVTEGDDGITVHYKDGTSKEVPTKDTTITVEDVNRTDSGIAIVYTDGDTKEIEISGGGGGTTTSGSASITRVTDSSTQCVYGDSCTIEFILSALDSSGDYVGDGTATWYVNSVKKATSTAYNNATTSFDIGQYLSVGTNTVKVSVSVDTGGDTPTTVTKSWTVNAVNMYAVWDYDDTTVNESDTVAIRWTPYGDLEKTTHLIIDGVEVATSTTTRSGVQQYVTINKLSHGSHLAELYLTATINKTEIRSASIFHDMMFADSGNTTPIISVSLGTYEMTQYNTLRIPVAIYTPGSLTSDAVLSVGGVEVAEWNDIDRTVHYWNYTPSESGTKVLTISSGATAKTITLTVNELDIDNEEVSGYAFRMKASDIASNEALRAFTNNNIGVSFSENFDWNNGGIKTEYDDDGNIRQFICVKAGTTMTVNYQLFGDDARVNGKSFKTIFKVTNSRDYDASFLNCVANGIGISLGANEGKITSEQNTVSVQYAEDSYVEFEFDVRKANEYRYLQTYLDGVISSTIVYAADDNFTQTNKQYITIGSADCDVYIYMVKAYESSLSMDNHIENFIADAPNAQEMVERYNRNDVLLDAGSTGAMTSISYSKLAAQAPDSRIHLWDIPRMTDGKKDYVDGCSYQQIYTNGDQRHQISAEGVRICIQGTSSVNYKDSGANTDGNFLQGFTDGNGNHIDTYSMTDESIPVSYFNTKVNVASCENINNMCLAEWYNRYQPYQTLWRRKNPQGRDCMELHMGVQFIKDQSHGLFSDDEYHMYAICNMGNSKKNLSVFHDADNPLECCVESLDNNSNYCLMIPNYDESGNQVPFDVAQLDSEDFFEFRYPDSPTDAMKNAFVEFVTWMTESNPSLATGNKLPSAVTYGAYTFKGHGNGGTEVLAGTTIDTYAGTYTHDTYEYRMAKMLNECEDHLVMDAMVYHYVFVEEHTMVDNVCKNTFWGTEDLQHWQLCKNYDNDTADGNDNNGKLIVPFGCEGMDMLTDTRDVFNGKSAVWWGFIYGLYDARRVMWLNRETAGAWDKDAYLSFVKSYQDILPERVWNQDYWYKYLRLYEQSSVTTYLDMLEGGKKAHQREAFVTNNMYYMASQYMGTACTGKSITMRGYTPSTWAGVEPKSEVTVMMYNKGYIVVQIGNIYKQLKAEKGKYYTISFSDSGDMNDTVINIHGANLVQAIGDISCLYVGRTDFASATRLRSIQIGSMVEWYSNPNLTEVSFGTNTMLEYLYIQNCPNVVQSLDLTGCQALRELDIRGSGFTGVSFALGGLIEKAYLSSPAALNMRSLYNLTDENLSLESYNNLTSLRLEDCDGIDSLAFITNATNLARVRILGINWAIADTTVLNRMLLLLGLDEDNYNVDTSVLAGSVYVSGAIRNQELLNYANAWENLVVTYDSSNLVTQYLATYVNANGDVLCEIYVDRGSNAPDPVATGVISTPTLNSDAQYDYTWSGWDNLSEMLSARTITATYDTTVRTYTVTWYSRAGLSLGSVEAEYGSEAVYSGDIPTNTEEEGMYIYNVFAGWNKSTGYITGDTDVYAIWDRAELPSTSKDLSEMSPAEIYAVATSGRAGSYFSLKDYTDIVLGHDFDFENVESVVLCENKVFDGATAIDTNIALFGADSPSFTLAIDFRFSDTTANNTLLSCFEEDGAEGFRLRYSSYPQIQWGDKTSNFGYQKYRDIVVIRHRKGDDKLYIYASNSTTPGSSGVFDTSIVSFESTRTRSTETDATITLGAVKYPDGGYDYYGSGVIYWCKLWYDDLGADNAKQLASWYHETLRMEYCGTERYRIGTSSTKCNASFIANNELTDRLYRMNSQNVNEGGWNDSLMRTFVNERVYDALPTVWKAMIKTVRVPTSAGSQSSEIVYAYDNIYLESYTALFNNTSEPYVNESSYISWYTSDIRRAKYRGFIIPDDASYYTGADEPSTVSSNIVKVGDVWKESTTNVCHILITAEDFARLPWTTTNGKHGTYTQDGKHVWISANNWWLRSPYVGSSAGFWFVGNGGYGSTNIASYAYGVCPCFSI
ncbi:MAG: DUF6273 domain-containing protein [Eubacteriales bacterium]|nr:DUF6273 domain-containing protein [Eubacteriales bacterium]